VLQACVDPVTIGFDVSLAEYIAAARAGGFGMVEWPVVWADAGRDGEGGPTRDLFGSADVEPIQFTCGLGVPGNLSVPGDAFRERLAEFDIHCDIANGVGCLRAAAFFDANAHAGVELDAASIVRRLRDVAGIARRHGISVVVGWHGRRLLELCPSVYAAMDGEIGLIVDTFTLARYGLGGDFVRGLPPGAVRWARVGDAVVASRGFGRRLLPGRGDIDIVGILRACRDNGYGGPFSIEVNDAPAAASAVERARRAYLGLMELRL
jgi:sugar phosphate isomerase/epimerase